MTTILRETLDAVRILTLNRPDKLNAANLEMQQALLAELRAVAEEPDIRALILTGSGRAFSAGGDRNILSDMAAGTLPPDTHAKLGLVHIDTIFAMLSLGIPAIAAVNGCAVGYSAGLVAMCDLVVMGASAFLSDPHVQYGIPATSATQIIWPRQCSELAARDILLSGRKVMAEEALRIGLCNRVCPDGEEKAVALKMAAVYAALPPKGVAETKRAFNAPLLAEAANIAVQAR
jgi:enoyl-CoA hydratase